MIKSYENVYILKGSMTEEQAKKEIENIKKYFKNTEVCQEDYLGKRKLAYSIGKETEGYYYLTHFKAIAGEVERIEMNLKSKYLEQ